MPQSSKNRCEDHACDSVLPVAQDGDMGMSIVELMIGATMVLLIIGSIITIVLQNSRLSQQDRELNLAFVACRNNLEQIRTMDIATLPALDGVGFDVRQSAGEYGALNLVPGDVDGLPGTFSVVVDKTLGASTMYRVRATVDWIGVQGVQKFELSTVIGARP